MATVELPDSIERQLLALDRQVRDAVFSRGLSRLGVAVPLLLGVCLAVDWALGLNSQVRMLMLGSWVLLTGFVAWRQVIGPALRAPSYSELAALVERQHPELKERLTSLVELRDYDAPGASPVMRDLLARQTTKAIERIDVSDAAPVVRSAGTALLALAAIALLFAPFAIVPQDYSLLWARMFAPWANYHWGSIELLIVDGDRVVAKGSDVPIQVHLQSRRSTSMAIDEQSVWLHWTDDAGIKDSRRLEWDAEAQRYATTLPHVARSLRLYAAAKSAQSETHRIDVADPPMITRFQLDIEPPAYMGLPARSLDGALGQVHAPERSRVIMKLDFNDAVTVAELIWPIPPETDPDAAPGDQQKRIQRTIAIKPAADGRSGKVEALALHPGPFAIHLKNKLGLTNDDPGRTLVVEPDLPPEITLQGTDEPVKVRVEDRHIVSSQFHDDYGLTAVELHLETSANQQKVTTLPADELKDRTLNREFPIDVADYDLKPGQALTYRFRAVDNRPIPNPQETWSKPRSLVVVSKLTTPPDKEVAQHEQTVKDQIDQLRKELAETKTELEKLHRKTEDEALKQKNSNKSEQLEKLEQRRAELAERLQKLAAELAERKLTEKLAERAEQLAANELADAGEKLAQAKQAEPRDQLQPLSEAIDRLASVDKQLQSLEQQLNDLNRLEQDLAQLEQVARNAERLAEQLEKLEQQPRDPNDQETAEQLRKLQADGQKLADDLNELFKKHPELLDAARRDQLEQLQQLAQQAEQLSKPQQQLAQSFQDTAKQQQDQPANDKASLNNEGQKPGENPAKNEGAENGPNAKPTQPGDGANAATNPQATGNDARAAGAKAAQDQQQLAQEATRQAIETARQQGADSKATQAATDFALKAAEAAQQAAAGDLSKAAKQAQAAAKSAEAAAKQASEGGQATPQQAQQAQSLAQRQQQLADELQQKSGSKAAQQGAQQQGQQQLADATEALAKQLEQAAKQLGSSPLDSKDAAEAASKATEAANEAKQAMQQAAQSAKSNNAQAAADQAKEAAEKLQQAARQAENSPNASQSGQAIPDDVASQVTQAAQQLQEAQKQLGAAAKESSQKSGQSGKPPENSNPNGTESKAGHNQPGQGQPGQGQPGQGDSAIAKTAKQFRNAANAMRQASNGEAGPAQPGSRGQGDSQQAQGEPGTEQGPAGGPGGNQAGGVTGTAGDLQDLNTELKKQAQRNWGQLPGQLKTEILQGANKKPRPEYEKQIKSYFEEISKPATKQTTP